MTNRERKWILFLAADKKLRHGIGQSHEAAKHGHRTFSKPSDALDAFRDRTRSWDMLVADRLGEPFIAELLMMPKKPVIVSFSGEQSKGLNILHVHSIPDMEGLIRFHLGPDDEDSEIQLH